jgi:alpha-D-ribose 1-methylphosphonate 5-triphosphate diphosphatase
MSKVIYNTRIVTPERVIEGGWLLIEGERIAAIGEAGTLPPARNATGDKADDEVIDAQGDYLLPGLVDLHCDAIEKLVEPRPNVQFDLHLALNEVDWRLAGCGVTTEFHAVSLDDDEFGIRSEGFTHRLADALVERDDWLVRHRIHARIEITSDAGCETGSLLMERGAATLVSLMDHSPGQGQYPTDALFRDYVIRTTGRSDAEIDALIVHKRQQSSGNNARVERIIKVARRHGVALATHDDDTAEKVETWPSLGVRVSEFPTTMAAARRAHELGLAVCMGAPNVLRGKSSGGNLSALEAIGAGVVDALCADYYPSAMLAAPFILADRGIMSLPGAINLVSRNPSRSVGLGSQLGSLAPGLLADILLVRRSSSQSPIVRMTFVGGRPCATRC